MKSTRAIREKFIDRLHTHIIKGNYSGETLQDLKDMLDVITDAQELADLFKEITNTDGVNFIRRQLDLYLQQDDPEHTIECIAFVLNKHLNSLSEANL